MSLDIWLCIQVDTGGEEPTEVELYSGNMTHNVHPMWNLARMGEALYESAGKQAGEVIEVLRIGIADMEARPDEYRKLNSPNGWGTYEGALRFVKEFLEACERHPKAVIGIWK